MGLLAVLDSLRPKSSTCTLAMQRLANYELLYRLGRGGMAEVWMARMSAGEQISKAVAIKLLMPPRVEDERYRRMFVEEARLTMLLGHSNIVQVFDAGSFRGAAYLVMEWVDGLNLYDLTRLARVRRLPFPNALAAHVIGEVLQALAYAHTVTRNGEPLGLIHRDVSPQNVLISVSGEVKLADFGIARLAHDETSGLFLKGKVRFMPPEQVSGVSNAPTVDLYAVGAILHELLEGVPYRDSVDNPARYAVVENCKVPDLRRRDVPVELDTLRRRLLEPEVKKRVGSALEALEILRTWSGYRNETLALARLCRLCSGVTGPRLDVEKDPSGEIVPFPIFGSESVDVKSLDAPERWRRWWTVAILGAGALAIAFGLGALALHDKEDDPGGRASGGSRGLESAGPADEPNSPGDRDAEPGLGSPETPENSEDPSSASDPSLDPSLEAENSAQRQGVLARVHFRSRALGEGSQPIHVRIRGADSTWQLLLEPMKRIDLPSGRFRIAYRVGLSDVWVEAGQIKIESGREYTAEISKDSIDLLPRG